MLKDDIFWFLQYGFYYLIVKIKVSNIESRFYFRCEFYVNDRNGVIIKVITNIIDTF